VDGKKLWSRLFQKAVSVAEDSSIWQNSIAQWYQTSGSLKDETVVWRLLSADAILIYHPNLTKHRLER